jgi:hypothetical protein
VPYKSGVSLMESALDNNPEGVLKLVWTHGLQITESSSTSKKKYRVVRRRVSAKDTIPL